MDSNYYVLRHRVYASKAEKERRVKALRDALQQLDLYQHKPGLKPNKVKTVLFLIANYETLLNSI